MDRIGLIGESRCGSHNALKAPKARTARKVSHESRTSAGRCGLVRVRHPDCPTLLSNLQPFETLRPAAAGAGLRLLVPVASRRVFHCQLAFFLVMVVMVGVLLGSRMRVWVGSTDVGGWSQ